MNMCVLYIIIHLCVSMLFCIKHKALAPQADLEITKHFSVLATAYLLVSDFIHEQCSKLNECNLIKAPLVNAHTCAVSLERRLMFDQCTDKAVRGILCWYFFFIKGLCFTVGE